MREGIRKINKLIHEYQKKHHEIAYRNVDFHKYWKTKKLPSLTQQQQLDLAVIVGKIHVLFKVKKLLSKDIKE